MLDWIAENAGLHESRCEQAEIGAIRGDMPYLATGGRACILPVRAPGLKQVHRSALRRTRGRVRCSPNCMVEELIS